MGQITTCDGSGVEIPAETPTTGIFGHQYSDEMRPVAESYLAELNELHGEMARTFQARLEALRALYRKRLRELPDDA